MSNGAELREQGPYHFDLKDVPPMDSPEEAERKIRTVGGYPVRLSVTLRWTILVCIGWFSTGLLVGYAVWG